jgi:hypothetical protein
MGGQECRGIIEHATGQATCQNKRAVAGRAHLGVG